ncbi:hypothetical protein [Cyanobacterium aponinum]|uniref:hypothetical protein n=1 Tax=Cyanobacterium aponinum TaxID=379064 RepID=UPI000C12C890|nr:hypothetical protein [Cyanobacterium aponinum]PHV61371.1 hypothetical protein CSQ80_15985 [Cyanobacterium aponinum IPPAS B-1201]
MTKEKNLFTISEEELTNALEISLERLDEIIDFFDSDPDDEWDLQENQDYIFLNKNKKIRKYSTNGALKIATYLDTYENRGIIAQIKEFITGHHRKIRNALAKKVILEELSDDDKIIQVNGRSMIQKQSLRRILATSGARLNKAIEDLRQSEKPLEANVDFTERESPKNKIKKRRNNQDSSENTVFELWFSGKGSVRIARELGENLKDKSRQKMCMAVSQQIEPVLQEKERKKLRFNKDIESAKNKAKKRDKNTCQITLVHKNDKKINAIAAHHLYSINKYPHLATSIDNLITIDERIHKEFHLTWMGGYDVECTVQDFIDFITERYPEQVTEELLDRLFHIQKTLKI